MTTQPISVIIPTYNRAHLLLRAVLSVIAQLTSEDELIIVDDGSTDSTSEILAPFGNRLRYIRTANRGAGAARNRGVQEAGNDLVAFLDSDDEWMPGKLALQRSFMAARPDVLFCFTDFLIDVDGRVIHHGLHSSWWCDDTRVWADILGPGVALSSITAVPNGYHDCLCFVGDLYPNLMRAPCASCWTMVVRRREAGSALHFAEDLPTYEDWECLGRIARQGPAAFLDCETAVNYGHTGPRLTDVDLLGSTAARLALLDRIWGSDPEFLDRHGDEFLQICQQQRHLKIRALIAHGQTAEAREEIGRTVHVPILYRCLAAAPGGAIRWLLGLRRNVLASL